MTFEQRLRRAVLVASGALGACVGTTTKDDAGVDTALADLCDGGTPPEDYVVSLGFVTVPPGTPCPAPAAAQLEVNPCSFLEWQHVTCGFDHASTDQVLVNDGYGGRFQDAATAETGILSDPVDVCYYQGVFYLPPEHPVCGRPLRADDGRPIVAGVRTGDGWAAGPAPDPSGLDAASRTEVGAFWLRTAALEHASVAAFAQVSAELLRHGAPPSLLRDTHRAALDEIGHAEACFALAAAYRGAPLAPEPLRADWPSPSASLADFAAAVAREGCVGEALAALDAAARLSGARDPAVREVLARIVREESAHAALAWRTLAWVLRQDGTGAARARVAGVLAEERARLDGAVGEPEPSPAAVAHGLVPPAVRARVLRLGWDDVVAPAWADLAPADASAPGGAPT